MSNSSVFTETLQQNDFWTQLMDDIKNPNPEREQQRQEALSALLAEWEAEDPQEQLQTWELLQKYLNVKHLSQFVDAREWRLIQ